MSVLKEFGEVFKVWFSSDSSIKKFLVESGISPERDAKKEIAENTSKILKENEETAVAMQNLAASIAELKETIKSK